MSQGVRPAFPFDLSLACALGLALAGCASRPGRPPPTPDAADTRQPIVVEPVKVDVPTDGSASAHPAYVAANANAEPVPVSGSDPTGWRTVGWISIAVGAEAAIVAGITSGMIINWKTERDAECNAAKQCSSNGLNANAEISAVSGWNAAAWVLAAAGLGAGTFIILTHPLPRERQFGLTLAPGGAAGLGAFGSF